MQNVLGKRPYVTDQLKCYPERAFPMSVRYNKDGAIQWPTHILFNTLKGTYVEAQKAGRSNG